MPRRNDISKILILGSGPIVIGQAAEFDYSGVQACKVLREEGYEVVLVNSNPATIMTDPELANKTYVEPLTRPYLEEIIRRERPDALLSTVGGQTGLNLSVELAEAGVLDKYGVELIGAKIDAIKKAEDRLLFKDAMRKIGLETPYSQLVTDVESGLAFAASKTGHPSITLQALTARSKYLPDNPSTYFLWATSYDTLHDRNSAITYYHHFLEASAGKFPDQEWQARQRLLLLEKKR